MKKVLALAILLTPTLLIRSSLSPIKTLQINAIGAVDSPYEINYELISVESLPVFKGKLYLNILPSSAAKLKQRAIELLEENLTYQPDPENPNDIRKFNRKDFEAPQLTKLTDVAADYSTEYDTMPLWQKELYSKGHKDNFLIIFHLPLNRW